MFANADHLPVSSEPIASLSQSLLDQWQSRQLEAAESYSDYRDALRDNVALRPFVEEGDRRFADRPTGIVAPLAFHQEALRLAGFRMADEVWRHHADAILIAIR